MNPQDFGKVAVREAVTTTVSALVEAMPSSLRPSIAAEISDIFTANSPPNPQHTSDSGSGHRRRPCTWSSSAAGCPAEA